MVEGIAYTSVEQFLAKARARLAANLHLAQKAMSSQDPIVHKRILYRMSSDGLSENWIEMVDTGLVMALYAKFLQNFLLEPGDLAIGEASRDMTWGIGMTLADKEVFDCEEWKGENKLGKALTTVRERISREEQK